MTRRTLSARSKGKNPNRSPHRGFSLVEVVISIVLLAIGTTLAIPSYLDLVEKRQLTVGAEQPTSLTATASCNENRTHGEPGYENCPVQEEPES